MGKTLDKLYYYILSSNQASLMADNEAGQYFISLNLF